MIISYKNTFGISIVYCLPLTPGSYVTIRTEKDIMNCAAVIANIIIFHIYINTTKYDHFNYCNSIIIISFFYDVLIILRLNQCRNLTISYFLQMASR